MPTFDEAGLRGLLEGLDDETLADLEWLVSRAEEEAAEGLWSQVHEAKASPGIERVRSAHFRAMDDLTSSLASGEIDLDEFKRRVHDVIRDSFRDAYSAGRGTTKLDDADEEWLRRATEAEVGYAHKFGEEIEAGDMSDDRRLQRVGMYADTVRGIDYSGQVESLPDDARIRWVLGNAEHCEDCLLLAANSPYTKWELPTTPRSGGTQCKSNCRCKLVFTRGKLTRDEVADAVEFGYRRDASLTELLAGPEPPEGLRRPTAAERRYLDRLWNEVNYQRRLIASGGLDDDAMAEALAARKAANQEIIDFLQKEKVWDAPLWDVDEVIDGRHLGRRAESDIFRSGIDGLSLSKVDEDWLGSLVDRYERTIGEDFGEAAGGREPGPAVVAGAGDEFCVVADSVENTVRMLGWALLEARGREVQVGPLRTDLALRVYVWLKGRDAEVTARALTRRVAARGGGAVAVPFVSAARERR